MVNTVLTTMPQGDFTTPDNFNRLNPPQITGGDEFFELLFTGAPKSFAEIKTLLSNREALPTFALPAVKLTFNIDATYQVMQTLQTHNVVGIVEGSDARLKDTYVLFGAHLDHTGYQAAPRGTGAGRNTGAAAGGGGRCPNVQPAMHQQRRRRRRVRRGDRDGHCEGVCHRSEAETVVDVHLARRRGVRVCARHRLPGGSASEGVAQLNMDMIGRDDTTTATPISATRSTSSVTTASARICTT